MSSRRARLREERILVTGCCGFMGSDFLRFLLTDTPYDGHVVNLDLLTYAANLENLKRIENDPRYTFVKGDICDERLVERLFSKYQFDLIVHFAAETHVDRSIDQPKTFIETNIVGTYSLLELVRRHPKTKLHLISTDEVYGDLPTLNGEFTEESPYAPSSPYAASKAAADHLVASYVRTFGVNATISHAGNNYGPGQHPEKLIPRMVEKLIDGEDLTINGSGEQVRDWLWVRDHSKAIYRILCFGKKGEVYNVGGADEKSTIDVVHHIIDVYAKLTKTKQEILLKKIIHVRDRPGQDFRYAMSVDKMKKEIGWEAEIPFDKGLKDVVEHIVNKKRK